MVFLPLSMRGESWGSYFVFLQPNSLTLHIAALGDGKCTENITKFEFIKNLFLLKPATATLGKKKSPSYPRMTLLGLCWISRNENTKTISSH